MSTLEANIYIKQALPFSPKPKSEELSRLRRNFFDRINTINKIFFIPACQQAGPEHPWPRPGFAGQAYRAPVRVFYGYPSRLYESRARAGPSIPGPDLAFVSLRALQSRRARAGLSKKWDFLYYQVKQIWTIP